MNDQDSESANRPDSPPPAVQDAAPVYADPPADAPGWTCASPPPVESRGISPMISIAIDFAVGFGCLIALVFLLGFAILVFHGHGLVPIATTFLALAAMVRAVWSRKNPWVEGLFLALGAATPVIIIALVAHGHLLGVARLTLALAAVFGAGAQTTRFLRTKRMPLAGAAVTALIVVVLIATKYIPMPSLPSPGLHTMDTPAPPIHFVMLDNATPVSLDSLRGRVVVLDFWGSWCAPCMAEMPAILKLHRRYQFDPGVVFFAVNPGWHGDTPDKIRAAVAREHMDIPVALDNDGAFRSLNITGLPMLVVIDGRGHIRMENEGYNSIQDLEGDLSSQIRQLQGIGAQ